MSQDLRYRLQIRKESGQTGWVVVDTHHNNYQISQISPFDDAVRNCQQWNAAYIETRDDEGSRDPDVEGLAQRLNDDDPDRPVTYGQVYVAVDNWLAERAERIRQDLTWYLLDAPDAVSRAVDARRFDQILDQLREWEEKEKDQ